MKISHARHGDQILITVEIPKEHITARGATVSITMMDDEWKRTARSVLHEYNEIEHKADPDELVARIRAALGQAALQSHEVMQPEIARRRMVSNVLHRVADMVQSGTIAEFAATWAGDDDLQVALRSKHQRETALRIQSGRGILEVA